MVVRRPGRVQVSLDPRFTHSIILEAEGVADAARAVDAAMTAPAALLKERREAHGRWLYDARQNALKSGWTNPPEPPAGLSAEESDQLGQRRFDAELHLELVVARSGDPILEAVAEREVDAMDEVRDHVEAIERLANEIRLLAKARRQVADAQRAKKPPEPELLGAEALVHRIMLGKRYPTP